MGRASYGRCKYVRVFPNCIIALGEGGDMTALCDLPATELRRLIGSKRISPVELLESCIARIEATDR